MTVHLRRWTAYCEPCDLDIELKGMVYMLARHVDEDATSCSLLCPSCGRNVLFTRQRPKRPNAPGASSEGEDR
jgi:hypothetical protein